MEKTYQVRRCIFTGNGEELSTKVPNYIFQQVALGIALGKLPEDWTRIYFHDKQTGFFYKIESVICDEQQI